MTLHHEYPHVTARRDALLWSMNCCLRALVARFCPGVEAGGEIDPLTDEWLSELGDLAAANAEDQEEALEGARRDDHA